MSTSDPLVTVVVPSFNETPRVVRASLESIRNQTLARFECIVVDESTDPELANACQSICAEDPRFIYIHPMERLGLPNSLNLAISQARSRLIARFDSDDVCMPERLALQVAFLEEHPEVSVVGGAINIISDNDDVLAHRCYPEDSAKIAKGMQFTTTMAHPTVMFRKEAIEQYGGYNPEFRFAEDLDLWLRWTNAGLLFANLPQVLVHYRQDITRRNRHHWHYNLRARISNFSLRYAIVRIAGIACIAVWATLPRFFQDIIFKFLIFHRRNQGVSQ
ncbi:glycosyltransferase [Chromobacterium violaceum]|uniref:glycosyltransferase n=1 Tax=Chromobacterium violaceum TaxID=536 RepID=UPI001CE1AEBD|nr:glycosyltransferase [Chromobacterium violaceum]